MRRKDFGWKVTCRLQWNPGNGISIQSRLFQIRLEYTIFSRDWQWFGGMIWCKNYVIWDKDCFFRQTSLTQVLLPQFLPLLSTYNLKQKDCVKDAFWPEEKECVFLTLTLWLSDSSTLALRHASAPHCSVESWDPDGGTSSDHYECLRYYETTKDFIWWSIVQGSLTLAPNLAHFLHTLRLNFPWGGCCDGWAVGTSGWEWLRVDDQ